MALCAEISLSVVDGTLAVGAVAYGHCPTPGTSFRSKFATFCIEGALRGTTDDICFCVVHGDSSSSFNSLYFNYEGFVNG